MNNRAFKALLKSKGYNREKLAEELKLSGNSVGKKYTGKVPWTWPEVCKVCAALGITLDEFATYYPAADVPAAQHRNQQAEIAELDALRNLIAAFKTAEKAIL